MWKRGEKIKVKIGADANQIKRRRKEDKENE